MRPFIFRLVVFAIALTSASGCKKQQSPSSSERATGASGGYTLVQKFATTVTDLIDSEGCPVNRWNSQYVLKGGSHLLENGDFLRSGFIGRTAFYRDCPGFTGVVERFNWDGDLQWTYKLAEPGRGLHHDIEPLPNGNVLMLVVEVMTSDEQIERGRDAKSRKSPDLWLDSIIEVKPTGPNSGEIVWEWRMWDHLIQDADPARKYFGVVTDHPERTDINFIENPAPVTASVMRQMQSIGYVGGGGDKAVPAQRETMPDWTHSNAIKYNAALDQILISVCNTGEVWVIDHSTTTAEAATEKGGRQNKGGGILFRWGNPQSYQRGGPTEQKLFAQHDAQWIGAGLPGAGNILIFNNGYGRKDGSWSSIEEIAPFVSATGAYDIEEGKAFGPASTVWSYTAQPATGFYSQLISGAQRMRNGNTLICDGLKGHVFEVRPSGEQVWEWTYVAPAGSDFQGRPRGPGQGPPGMRRPSSQGGPPGGPGVGVVLSGQATFRAVRYSADFPAFAGKEMKPLSQLIVPAVSAPPESRQRQ